MYNTSTKRQKKISDLRCTDLTITKKNIYCTVNKYIGSDARQQGYPTPFFLPEYVSEDSNSEVGDIDMGRLDPLFEDAARLVVIHQQGSTSLIQRKFAIGYNRAGRIMDQLEKAGIVGPTQGSKARDVLCIDDNDLEMRLNNLQ